jgi:hypothetical protein
MQSVSITTKFVGSNPALGEVYSIPDSKPIKLCSLSLHKFIVYLNLDMIGRMVTESTGIYISDSFVALFV